VNKTNSVIEVNGNRYDAVTGQLLSAGKKIRKSTHSSGKKMIDGFVLGAHNTKAGLKKTSAVVAAANRPKTVAQGLHQPPQRPKTLIRKGLNKPSGGNPKAADITAAARRSTDPAKEMRAKTVTQHSRVNRFGHFARPQQTTAVVTASPSVRLKKNNQSSDLPPPPPSMITSISHRKLERLLDEGLMRADAHKHMLNHRKRQKGLLASVGLLPRWISYSVAGFVLVMLAAFLIWQNLPAVAVHVAAAKAHVNASMPSYTPTGFGYVGPLQYEQGAVTLKFQDKVDANQKFLLTQQASNWNSASLEANSLPKDTNIQTSEINGTTVYIYGDKSDAKWVNHNVLYSLKNEAQLSSDQVLRIVQSL
jgi:hypothetical protein